MRNDAFVSVIIPAFNEESAIAKVLEAIPDWVDRVVVSDNGSTDGTADVARSCGAAVVSEPRRGYGAACLKAMTALDIPDVVVFLDGDYSDYPEDMAALVDPIVAHEADLVIGSRTLGQCKPGALTPQQRFGNRLSCLLVRLFWRTHYTDLGPFRAVSARALTALRMRDRNWGWTVEMQVKAARLGLRTQEVPVRYRKRIGASKVSGTVKGALAAGVKILYTIFREALWPSAELRPLLDSDGLARVPLPRECLIVFTRHPEPGSTKTRMIPALGKDGAAGLQRDMTVHAVVQARQVRSKRGTWLRIEFDGGSRERMSSWLGPDLTFVPQHGDDLGHRMQRAFASSFCQGADRVVIIGADCPDLTRGLIEDSFKKLHECDVVLGPASDGGYYLIGLSKPIATLLHGIEWGTDTVFDQQTAIVERLGVSLALLPLLDDVDRPEDLDVWRRVEHTIAGPHTDPDLSVIVPALNEESIVAETLAGIRAAAGAGVEILVVDGGSSDGTVALAASYGARIVHADRGRAAQMNEGAAQARAGILLFIHADTRVPEGFMTCVTQALAQPGVAAGAFALRIGAGNRSFRFIERVANLRARRMGLPYGDQGLFLARKTFEEIGGFRDMPVMEDVEIVRRLRRIGRLRICEEAAVTSARRWLQRGPLRLCLRHIAIVAGYLVGVSPNRLVKLRGAPRG